VLKSEFWHLSRWGACKGHQRAPPSWGSWWTYGCSRLSSQKVAQSSPGADAIRWPMS